METRGVIAAWLELGRRVWRPIARKGWMHWLRFAALLAVGSYVGHILSESPRFADIRYAIYQFQTRIKQRGPIYPQHTVLVLLDDDDYWTPEYQARQPLKLGQMAILLDRLNAAGANTVGFDIFLSSPLPSKPEYDFPDYVADDQLFFAAIRRMCDAGRHVVLTADVEPIDAERRISHQYPSIYDAALPSMPCVTVAHDRFAEDMRRIPGVVDLDDKRHIDSMSLAMVRITDPVAYEEMVKGEDRGFRFGEYLTPSDFGPRAGRKFIYNGVSVRTMDLLELRRSVADKLVIVGGAWSLYGYGFGPQTDLHASPGGDEPGAMLHANYVESELGRDSTFAFVSDRTAEILEWGLAFVLALISATEVLAAVKWLSVLAGFALSAFLTYVLMQNLGLFLDFLVPMLMIVAHTFTEKGLEMHHELKHARRKLKEHHPKEHHS